MTDEWVVYHWPTATLYTVTPSNQENARWEAMLANGGETEPAHDQAFPREVAELLRKAHAWGRLDR